MKNSIVFIMCVMLATALTVVSGCDKNNPDDNGQQPVLERLIMDTTDLVLEEGQTYALEVSTVPENAVDVELTWKSSDSLVATVSGTGLVTAVSEGEAVITAASSGIEAICNVTVVPAEEEKPEVETVTVTPSETVVMIGETVTLGVTVTPEDADYTLAWSSSDSDIASVDDNGTVTALAAGKAVITAEAGGKTGSCTVTVTPVPVESIALDVTALTLEEGESYTLTAEVMPENATDRTVSWSSSDESTATVDNTGKVTAVKAGTATVTAQCGEVSATCEVTVKAPVIPANVGDYYYSDGTWSTELDASKELVGLVFYTGDVTAEDPVLAQDHSDCTHGLVISLNNTSQIGAAWQVNFGDGSTSVSDWVSANLNGYAPMSDTYNMTGYSNTKALEAYNSAMPENAAGIISDLTAFREAHQAPASSSGWYIPSASEWAVISAGDYDGDALTLASAVNLELINGMLEKIEGADKIEGFDMGIMVLPGTFWSSTEMNATQGAGFVTSGSMVPTGKAEINKIRAILAF